MNEYICPDCKCNKIEYMNEYPIFCYGFPEKIKVTYNEIRPCSEKIGILSLDKIIAIELLLLCLRIII